MLIQLMPVSPWTYIYTNQHFESKIAVGGLEPWNNEPKVGHWPGVIPDPTYT